MRLSVAGALISEDLRYKLQLSTAPGAVELIDLYLDYRFAPQLQARLGQLKLPFTRYRLGSFSQLTLVEWAPTSKYFGAERQLGLCLHNGFGSSRARLAYEVGLFSGVNARASHAVGLARAYGETPRNPSDLIDPAPQGDLHPELAARLAYQHNGIDARRDTDFEGGGLRLSVSLSAAWDLDPLVTEDLALRLAPELLVKYRGASLAAVLYLGFDRAAGDGADVTVQRLAMLGGLAQASYLFAGKLELAARWSAVFIDEDLLAGARTRARVTNLQTPGALDPRAGTLQRDEERSVGLNVYLVGATLKWQTDLSWLIAGRADGSTHNSLRLRTQLQLLF